MSSILATTLFTMYAAAQLTTSVWLPGAATANQSFVGSIIGQSGDETTLSLAFADGPAKTPDYYSRAPDTVTLRGMTFIAYEATAADPVRGDDNTVTVSLECSRAGTSAVPTCTLSTFGADAIVSALCAGISADEAQYCTDSTALTFDQTLTLGGDSQHYLNNFQVVLTAGAEKLGASTAATPTAGSASVTMSEPVHAALETAGSSPSQTSVSSSGFMLQQSTNAAAPMGTTVPTLAGLAAAAAAYFL